MSGFHKGLWDWVVVSKMETEDLEGIRYHSPGRGHLTGYSLNVMNLFCTSQWSCRKSIIFSSRFGAEARSFWKIDWRGWWSVFAVMLDFPRSHWSNLSKASMIARHSFLARSYRCSVGLRLLELYVIGCNEESSKVPSLCCMLGCRIVAPKP